MRRSQAEWATPFVPLPPETRLRNTRGRSTLRGNCVTPGEMFHLWRRFGRRNRNYILISPAFPSRSSAQLAPSPWLLPYPTWLLPATPWSSTRARQAQGCRYTRGRTRKPNARGSCPPSRSAGGSRENRRGGRERARLMWRMRSSGRLNRRFGGLSRLKREHRGICG